MSQKEITTIQYLTGTKEFKPIEYRLIKRIIKCRFWFDKVEYGIKTDYSLILVGSKDYCYELAAFGGINLIDCTGE